MTDITPEIRIFRVYYDNCNTVHTLYNYSNTHKSTYLLYRDFFYQMHFFSFVYKNIINMHRNLDSSFAFRTVLHKFILSYFAIHYFILLFIGFFPVYI